MRQHRTGPELADRDLDFHFEIYEALQKCFFLWQDSLASDKMAAVLSDIRFIRDVLSRFKHLAVDRTEYACLKAVVLFRPGMEGVQST